MHRTILFALILSIPGAGALAQWQENFDSYPAGAPLVPQGGWERWYSGGGDGFVTDALASSPPNSLIENTADDMVHKFSISGGKWVFKVKLYIPTGATGDGYVILMNKYGSATIDNWSLQVRFGGTDELVEAQWYPLETVPLIRDQWVELRADIDLDGDLLDLFYNNAPLSLGRVWTTNVSGTSNPGTLTIACVDLFSSSMDNYYYDDLSLMPGVLRGDTNCDGLVNPFDIDPFVACMVSGTPTPPCTDCLAADINQDGVVNPFDIDPFVVCVINGACP